MYHKLCCSNGKLGKTIKNFFLRREIRERSAPKQSCELLPSNFLRTEFPTILRTQFSQKESFQLGCKSSSKLVWMGFLASGLCLEFATRLRTELPTRFEAHSHPNRVRNPVSNWVRNRVLNWCEPALRFDDVTTEEDYKRRSEYSWVQVWLWQHQNLNDFSFQFFIYFKLKKGKKVVSKIK